MTPTTARRHATYVRAGTAYNVLRTIAESSGTMTVVCWTRNAGFVWRIGGGQRGRFSIKGENTARDMMPSLIAQAKKKYIQRPRIHQYISSSPAFAIRLHEWVAPELPTPTRRDSLRRRRNIFATVSSPPPVRFSPSSHESSSPRPPAPSPSVDEATA